MSKDFGVRNLVIRTWFRSTKGAMALSFMALLSVLVRSYVDTRFILVEDFSDLGVNFVLLWILVYTAFIGSWVWALISATRGSRRALFVLLGYALLTGLGFGAASFALFLSVSAELFFFAFSLISGALASVSLAWLLWRAPGGSHSREAGLAKTPDE